MTSEQLGHVSSQWVDKTNYYSLPRPYNRSRDSIPPPQDPKPATFTPSAHALATPQMHREQIVVLPSGTKTGFGNRGKPAVRPNTISPQRFISPAAKSRIRPSHNRVNSTGSSDLVKAEVFLHPGMTNGADDTTPSSGTWLTPTSEHNDNNSPTFHPLKFKKDRFSFYSDLLELEKRAQNSEPLFVRLDDDSHGPGKYVAYFGDPSSELTRSLERNKRNKLRNYVTDIAGAHLPVYQRIGGFQGVSRFEVDEQRTKADRLMTNYFVRQSRGRERGGPFNGGAARRERPASAVPADWDPVVYVGPVAAEHKLSAFNSYRRAGDDSRTDYRGSGYNVTQNNSGHDDKQLMQAKLRRNEQIKGPRQRLRSHSATRPHTVYYF